jgi:hypothetical protein
MANSDSTKGASDRQHESYADDAKAQRVLGVNATGAVSGGTVGTAEFIKLTDGTNTADLKINVNTTNTEVLVNLEGHECPDNTTVAQLAADASFTGTDWQDTLDYGVLSINIASDQNSATDGLDIQWSNDGVTVDDHDYFTITANTPKTFTFGPAERYYRVKYTNGSDDTTTTFHLTSIIRKGYVKSSSHRIQDNIVGEDDAELVKAVNTGIDDNGIFRNVNVDSTGRMKVVAQPYIFSIAEGTIPDHFANLKFGTRTGISAGDESTIWEGPTNLYVYPPSALTLSFASTSDLDGKTAAPSSTGARTLYVEGLDTNYAEINETITLDGTTVVTTANQYLRVFRAYVATCGTGYTNAGIITGKNAGLSVTYLTIPAGDSQTLMALWTVPAGKKMFITQGTASTDSNKGATVSLFARLNDSGTLYPWRIQYRAYIFSGNEVFPFQIPFQVPAKTDIEFRFLTPVSAGATDGGATFEYWYEDV